MISARERAQVFLFDFVWGWGAGFFFFFFFEKCGCENLRFLYVFVTSDLEVLKKLMVLEGFRHARAAESACGLYGII